MINLHCEALTKVRTIGDASIKSSFLSEAKLCTHRMLLEMVIITHSVCLASSPTIQGLASF